MSAPIDTAPPALGRESGVWLPIETAPRDGTVIWAIFRDDLSYRAGRDDMARWNGLQIPLRHIGIADSEFDPGWEIAAPVGFGGFGDRWIAGWMPLPGGPDAPFQARVDDWVQHCFGAVIRGDKAERNHRFIEEALELVQAAGCTASEAHQLVDYVFGRPVGDINQEVGGVMNTLAALCNAHGVDLNAAAETELRRVWTKSDQIRAKQAAKPKHSPLPA